MICYITNIQLVSLNEKIKNKAPQRRNDIYKH